MLDLHAAPRHAELALGVQGGPRLLRGLLTRRAQGDAAVPDLPSRLVAGRAHAQPAARDRDQRAPPALRARRRAAVGRARRQAPEEGRGRRDPEGCRRGRVELLVARQGRRLPGAPRRVPLRAALVQALRRHGVQARRRAARRRVHRDVSVFWMRPQVSARADGAAPRRRRRRTRAGRDRRDLGPQGVVCRRDATDQGARGSESMDCCRRRLPPEGERLLHDPGDRRQGGGITVVPGLGRSQPPVPVAGVRARCAGHQRHASGPLLLRDGGLD